ncbi:hypothetical protein KFD70_22110 [Bacillus pfraonensis]|uniref:YopX family protein n=1 Tax=Bacillus pfraonensis TaxID=2830844 RepID=UPI003D6E1BD9
MREIKFRTWDKKYHMLEYDASPDLLIGTDGKVYQKEERNYAGTSYVEYEVANYYEIMQYTGLKDKNGKEIYEGDIVSRHEGGIHFQEEPLAEHVVRWGKFGWSPFEIGQGYQKCVYGEIYEFIVIGNIYENPELLKTK